MRVANGVEMLEISQMVLGRMDVIHPTLIWDEEMAILVDTGYPGQIQKFQDAMEQAGVPFAKLGKIVLTHQDIDHIGSLPNLLQEALHKLEVLAHEVEKPYIQGEKRLIKITPEVLANLDKIFPPDTPEEMRKAFRATFENPPKAPVDTTIADGEELPYSGGVIVIDTPGHTPGHISLYHTRSKTLIAGDALVVIDGHLHGSVPQHTVDPEQALQSIKKLTQYDIEQVICYHGGLYTDNVNQRLRELAKTTPELGMK